MTLSPKAKRVIWVSAAVIVILLALGAFFTWSKFFREEKEVFANEEEHFKYGSLGAEGDRGIPFYFWLVLPPVFPDLFPGRGGSTRWGGGGGLWYSVLSLACFATRFSRPDTRTGWLQIVGRGLGRGTRNSGRLFEE